LGLYSVFVKIGDLPSTIMHARKIAVSSTEANMTSDVYIGTKEGSTLLIQHVSVWEQSNCWEGPNHSLHEDGRCLWLAVDTQIRWGAIEMYQKMNSLECVLT